MSGRVIVLRGDAARLPLPDASIDAIVTDPPYGLEFMGREWDTFKTGDGFRRSRNEADTGRDSVFGRTSRTAPEYSTGKPSAARIRERVDGRTNPKDGKSTTRTPEAYVAGSPFQRWCEAWARECLRVLRPGGYLLAFGGTRTWHRLVCGIEDAGFEVRDAVADLTGHDAAGLMWTYGSGFPKSLDVSKAIDKAAGVEREVVGPDPFASRKPRGTWNGDAYAQDSYQGLPGGSPVTSPATEDAARWSGWGTALKPGWEPIAVARKPLAGTVAQNVLTYGTGALNIDGCRVDPGSPVPGGGGLAGGAATRHEGWRRESHLTGSPTSAHDAGRWPPNVLLSEEAAAEMDRQSGMLTSGANPTRRGSDKFRDAYGDFAGQTECTPHRSADSGGASRFFPVFRYEAKADAASRPRLPDGTAWPTVKPVALMRWLVRLVTPPGGVVLDLFAGTGTTGEAAIIEGFDAIVMDKDPQAIALTRARLSKPIQPLMFGTEPADPAERARALGVPKPPPVADDQGSLFDLEAS